MKRNKPLFLTIKNIFLILAPIISIAALVLVWVLASRTNTDLVPTPMMVWARLIKIFEKPISGHLIFGHIWASMQRVLIALFFGLLIGIPFGIMIGWSKSLSAIFGSVFELIRPIPPIAWIPIVIMWLGIGELPKIVIVFIGVFMPIVINTSTGIKLIDKINLDVGRMFNANERQLLLEIAIPSALPSIFAGFRGATSSGFMVVLAAEMIGAKAGLGFLITRGMESFDVPLIMVGMLTIAIVGALLAIITDYAERKLISWGRNLDLS